MYYYYRLNGRNALFCGLSLSLGCLLQAQTADDTDDEIIELSPFEVTTSDVSGYTATHTLAGTRIRTDLKDIASSVSVFTEDFLKDTGATDNASLLVYTPNTEVGGVYGNFSGMGGASTYNESANLLRPSNNTRVRGLDAADNTRDFFLSEVPWDGYIVDRVEMQRGPNSILFGVGSPAGIINTTTKTAIYSDVTTVELRYGSFGSMRGSFDINREVIEDVLAIRIAGLLDETKFRQKPAYDQDKRWFAAVRFEPKIFGEGSTTSIRANFENGTVKANRPRSLPPVDAITPWFWTGERNGIPNLNKLVIDPYTTWNQYGDYEWFREANLGRMFNSNYGFFLDGDSETPLAVMNPTISNPLGRGSDGSVDTTIDGIPFAKYYGVATFNNYARVAVPGGKYYSNYSLSDSSIYNFYNKLIDGPNKEEWQKWNTGNISLAQTFLHNRVGYELVVNRQSYDDGQYAFLGGDQYAIGLDFNSHLLDRSPNPNLGRPYVSNSGQYGNQSNAIDRTNLRATAFGDFRFDDVLEESWLTRILGRHVLTGLASKDEKETDYRSFARWASEPAYTGDLGIDQKIISGLRQVDWVAYLGPSLLSASSAAGAHLNNVSARFDPSGPTTLRLFDSHWNSPDVAFDAPYEYNYYEDDGSVSVLTSTQSENPDNYVGWTTGTYNLLNADKGDIRDLYTQVQKSRNEIKSTGLTLQSYLFDNLVVATYGWRRDTVKNAGKQGDKLTFDVSDPDFKVDFSDPQIARGESRTWGVVVHTPDFIKEVLPLGSSLSAFYNRGQNFKADAPRGDIFGNQIDNPQGKTKEYGLVLSTLDDRVTVKATWYETKVTDASLGADSAGFSSNLYYVWALPYWGATHALAALDGIADPQIRQGNWGWPWNNIAEGDPARIYDIVEDFFRSFPLDQHFADEYGLGMNVAAMRAGTNPADWYASIPTYGLNTSGVYDEAEGAGASGLGLQPAYGGNLLTFGSGPVASVDTTAKGVEIEIQAKLLENWDVTVNFSKTDAKRTAISPSIDQWIDTYTEFLAGDAGLLTLWGGDTFRDNWENNILAPYAVLKGQIGSAAPEVSPWRFNAVTNYSFNEGRMKGVNIGMAYRWEDKRILGYQYDSANDILDIDKPWYGPTESHLDVWIGYGHQISDDIDWRIQLNLRNVGESVGLTPVNIQPDGSVALSRIQEGMTWTLTNTFSF